MTALGRLLRDRETGILEAGDYPFDHAIDVDDFTAYGDQVVDPLLARLDDGELRIVIHAGLVLERLPQFADAIVPRIVPRLSDPHPWVAEAMIWILHELGDAAHPALLDAYASHPAHARAIARAMAARGPDNLAIAHILRDDAARDPDLAAALDAIQGPYATPDEPMPYLGESLWLGSDGPSERDHFGRTLWLEIVSTKVRHADDDGGWSRAHLEDRAAIDWWPRQIAFGARAITIGAFNWDDRTVATTELLAEDGGARGFTKQELLHRILVAQHELGPCNDRIFEGLQLDDEAGHHYIKTGS